MGVKIRNSHSTQNENDQIFATAGGTGSFGLPQVLGTYTNPSYYDGSFKIGGLGYGPTSDYAKIQQAIAADLASASPTLLFQQLASVQKSQGAFFDANERVSAGYIQNAISVGKFRFQAGVRFRWNQHRLYDPSSGRNGDRCQRKPVDHIRSARVPATSMRCPAFKSSINSRKIPTFARTTASAFLGPISATWSPQRSSIPTPAPRVSRLAIPT